MKKENGLTIISVLIYIIALLIILGVVATLTSYFYKNINIEGESQLTNAQFTKFSGYITEEINQDGVRVVEVGENENVTYITFTNKQTYTYSKVNKAIYVNEINTIPGSLSFYLWEPKGVKFSELLDKAIRIAIKRQERRNKITYSTNVNILNMTAKK